MATSQVIETFQLGTAQGVKRENASVSGAEKSHDFENIFDKANKSYSSEKSSSTEVSAKDSQASAKQVDKKSEESKVRTNNESNNQQSADCSTDTESKANDVTSESAEDSTQDTDASMQSDKQEEVKSESVKTDVQAQTALIDNVQSEVVAPKEKQPVLDVQKVQADSDEVSQEASQVASSFEQVAVKIQSVVVSSNDKKAQLQSVLNEDLALNAKEEIAVQSEDSAPQSPIVISAETVDLMAKAAIDNLSAQKPINAVSNPNVQQNASTVGIENSALIEKMVPDNAKVVANESADSSAQKSAVLPAQQPMMSVASLQQEQNSSPVVQVAADALSVVVEADTSGAGLVSEVKENGKNSLTQDILDSLDAKITSVKTSTQSNADSNMNSNGNSNGNSNHQGLLAQQNTQDQAVMLQLESSANLGTAPTVSAVDLTATAQVDLATSAQVNTSSIQSQNAQIAKEITHSDIMEQVNKQLDLKNAMSSQNNESTKINIILRPENLGKVELELISTKDGLIAKLTAENAQVKEALDKNLDGLKESLGAQGVNVNTVSVKINEAQKQDTMFSFDKQPGQEQNQQQNSKQAQESHSQGNDDIGDIDELGEDLVLDSASGIDATQSSQISSNVDYKI